MKKHQFLSFLLLQLFVCIYTSFSPATPSYGGKIQIKNNSSYNIYIIFQTVSNTKKMLCIEKNEQLQITHTDDSKESADPAKYYTGIVFYDFDSGTLLKELTADAGLFTVISGSIDKNNALFEFSINDAVLGITS